MKHKDANGGTKFFFNLDLIIDFARNLNLYTFIAVRLSCSLFSGKGLKHVFVLDMKVPWINLWEHQKEGDNFIVSLWLCPVLFSFFFFFLLTHFTSPELASSGYFSLLGWTHRHWGLSDLVHPCLLQGSAPWPGRH